MAGPPPAALPPPLMVVPLVVLVVADALGAPPPLPLSVLTLPVQHWSTWGREEAERHAFRIKASRGLGMCEVLQLAPTEQL